jgi:cytochrome c peroxidase
MKKNILTFTAIAIATLTWQSCQRDTAVPTTDNEKKLVLPTTTYDYVSGVAALTKDMFNVSKSLNANFNGTAFAAGNINNNIATLGRVLFYDPKMSINNTVACGNCHLQSKAFSDIGEVSFGFKSVQTTRNSMSIANPIMTSNLFWDSRSRSLSEMALKPVQNHIEMGMEDLDFLAAKLQNTGYYPDLFKKAFGYSDVNSERINRALTQFLASMVTHDSKFDVGAREGKFTNFNTLELLGKDLFMSERLSCNKCHTGGNFSLGDDVSFSNPYGHGSTGTTSSNGTANIGLDMVYKDNGSGNGKFKIPSLRNIELTAPYMHDGRFKTLEQVIEHYNSGIQAHTHLDKNLKDITGAPKKMDLSSLEKNALLAFLKTLSDPIYTTDVKYSNPFQ